MGYMGTSLVAQRLKRLPAMWETWVRSLSREDPLEKKMATHSSTLAWKNPMDGRTWQATVHGVAKRWTRLSDFTFSFTGGLDWPLNEGVGMVTMFNFLEELPNCFSDVTAVIYISSVMYEGFNFSTSVLIPGFIKLSLVGVKF